MSENAMTEKFDAVELFDRYALFSNFRIDRDTVPSGWHCYDIRGTDYDFGELAYLERFVLVNHAGTILSPHPIPFPEGVDRLDIREELGFTEDHDVTLAEFCKLYGFEDPNHSTKYVMRPASPDEAGLFYAISPEQDAELGCIGHVRIDFGRSGDRFYHTWHPRGPEELNTQEFKDELTEVVDELRDSVLKNLAAMTGYCRGHGGEISGGLTQNYGYIVETENYRYCLRCTPIPGDYQAYLNCFDKRVQEMNQCQQDTSQPVGQIKYLGSSGQTRECVPYYDADKFIEDIMHSNYYGEPMVIEVFKDEDGQTIPLDFVERLDPPVPVSVVEYSEGPVPLEIHSLAALKRTIKPGTELMATYHSKHPETVGLVRVVTEVQTNGFYSKIKDQPDHKYSTYNHGRGFRTDYEKASCYQFDGTTIRVLDARKNDGSVLMEFEVYEPRMEMEAQEENEESFTMTMGGM